MSMPRAGIVCAVVALAHVACETAAERSPRVKIRMLDSTVIASPLVQEFARRLPQYDFELVPAGPASLTPVVQGGADVAVVMADTAYFAYASGPTARNLRGLSVIPELPIHLLVRADKGIDSIADLRGRTIVLVACTGCPETSVAQSVTADSFAGRVLSAYSINPAEVRGHAYTIDAVNDALRSGKYDAAMVQFYYPAPVVSTALRGGFRLLPLEGPAIDRVRLQYPFVREVRIPPGTYEGQSEVIRTIGVDRLLVCRSDLDERTAYMLTKALVEGLQELSSALHSSFRHMDMERAPATPIPIHAGAARYFREWELFR